MAIFSDRVRLRPAFVQMCAPYVFVILWSTGFIGARYCLPFAEPFTLLSLRFILAIAILLAVVLIVGARWPLTLRQAGHVCVVGLLAHGGYLGGNFLAMATPMPLGIVALVGGLQPLLTAVAVGPLLNEKVSLKAWSGFCLGLIGVFLVLLPKLGTEGITPTGIAGVTVGLISMTAATIYQKRYCPHAPLLTGAAIQYVAALGVIGPLALVFETGHVVWTGQFVFAVIWLAVVLSIGAITLLWLLVRRGEAAKVSSVFYLTPPVTALLAYALFGEKLGAFAILGMVIAASGVALVTVPKRAGDS